MLTIRRFNSQQASFQTQFSNFLEANTEHESDVSHTVQDIIAQIRTKGDSALLDFTHKFDRLELANAQQLEISQAQLQDALTSIDPAQRVALEQAHKRVEEYAEHQRLQSWQYTDEHGSLLGQRVTPLDRVGIYVPGGTAAYPSSVLMNAVPAKVAGVPEIIMVAPTPDGKLNTTVLAAAAVAGVDRVFRIGGAQAVAALAYGTETVPPVDKIVGPGNIFVATAKRMVFGKVGIDMIAGPSEVLVICDDSANPEWIAMDLFSQAEHDVLARTTLLSTSEEMLNKVESAMNELLPTLERAEIIEQAINAFGCYVKVDNLEQAAKISNQVAPEHLELSVRDPEKLLESIQHAGAVFMGHHTPEVFGDYCAGPNHVLPTSATARFSSPLGVYDFQKRMTILNCSNKGALQLSGIASTLAHSEGLTAHAKSAEFRGSVK
ncbi:MAG: histidinol dehydrogenase [Gammaproteobacteria bacterium]|nr:histidinol dehydrogenase [Gammaproteobacteria bacterium]